MVAVDSQTRTMSWLMTGELLEAERVHSMVGAFFTRYTFYRFIDFPKRFSDLIRASFV